MNKHNVDNIKTGFSLTELLVTVVILGILSTLAITVTIGELERARINTAQIALAGWLQVVQRSALLKKSPQIDQGGCTVTFPASLSSGQNGSQIAIVAPSACSPNPTLVLDISNLGNSTISASFTQQEITFTPRGTINSLDPSPVSEIRMLISNSRFLRCIRLSGLAGVIEIGSRGSGSTLGDQCTDYSKL